MKQFSWGKSVWFLDVDDTVLDTDGAHEAGSAAALAALEPVLGTEKAGRLIDRFNQYYWLIRQGYSGQTTRPIPDIEGGKAGYEKLLARIRSYQAGIMKQYGTAKLWSREVLLKLSADELAIALPPAVIEPAIAALWEGVAKHSSPLPDAVELISAIRQRRRSVHLFTSSDGRLSFDGHTFAYDPEESRRLKQQRIEPYRGLGLNFDTLTIGDPFDKPDPRSFQSMIDSAAKFLGYVPEPADCVMVGDSMSGDLAVPHGQLGFGLSVWYQPENPAIEWLDDSLVRVPDLRSVAGFFSD